MISAGVTVVGSFGSVEGTTGSTTVPTKWWTCHLIPGREVLGRVNAVRGLESDLIVGSRRAVGKIRIVLMSGVGRIGLYAGRGRDVLRNGFRGRHADPVPGEWASDNDVGRLSADLPATAG